MSLGEDGIDMHTHEVLDGPHWSSVARLIMMMASACRSGQSSLVKFDGLRDNGSIYTVVIDGAPDEGPLFRLDSSDLLSTLKDAVNTLSPLKGASASPSEVPLDTARLLAYIDKLARSGQVICIRLDASNGTAPFLVSVLGRATSPAFFDKRGEDLSALLLSATVFHREHVARFDTDAAGSSG